MSPRLPLAARAVLATGIPVIVLGIVPWLLLRASLPFTSSRWRFVLVLPMTAGIALLAWCAVLFARTGHGTLAPMDPPTVFVAHGPYRVTRNPMYLGAMLWLASVAAFTGVRSVAWYVVIVAAGFHAFVVLVEEPGLRQRFGASYEAYVRCVPRWLGRIRDGAA